MTPVNDVWIIQRKLYQKHQIYDESIHCNAFIFRTRDCFQEISSDDLDSNTNRLEFEADIFLDCSDLTSQAWTRSVVAAFAIL